MSDKFMPDNCDAGEWLRKRATGHGTQYDISVFASARRWLEVADEIASLRSEREHAKAEAASLRSELAARAAHQQTAPATRRRKPAMSEDMYGNFVSGPDCRAGTCQLAARTQEINLLRAAKDARIAELDHECKAGMEQIASERARAEQADAQLAEAIEQASRDSALVADLRAKLVETKSALSAMEAKMKMQEQKRCCTICDAKKVCHVCGDQTLWACSDCQISLGATVYVCGKRECREYHDSVCSARIAFLEKSVTVLREALEPFAKAADYADKEDAHPLHVTYDDLRRARAALIQATTEPL